MSEKCPGIPEECEHARSVLTAALDGMVSALQLAALRDELGACAPCLKTFDLEIQFRTLMSQRCREAAPEELRLRIAAAMERVDLGHLDVTDL